MMIMDFKYTWLGIRRIIKKIEKNNFTILLGIFSRRGYTTPELHICIPKN